MQGVFRIRMDRPREWIYVILFILLSFFAPRLEVHIWDFGL